MRDVLLALAMVAPVIGVVVAIRFGERWERRADRRDFIERKREHWGL